MVQPGVLCEWPASRSQAARGLPSALLGVLLFHGLVVYTTLLKTLTGLSPAILLQKMRRVWAFAFSTASSGATPAAIKAA